MSVGSYVTSAIHKDENLKKKIAMETMPSGHSNSMHCHSRIMAGKHYACTNYVFWMIFTKFWVLGFDCII